ncbi:MAG: glycosyltransferase [Gemmatimonadales bacterium]
MDLPSLLGLAWLAPFVPLLRLMRREPRLDRVRPARGQLVSIIIPARNESASITTVIESILESTYEPFELLVVDDRSTDDTATLVRALAARDPRVRLISGAPLPSGWYGKPWACFQGYLEARGELLLFTDADTRHAPGLLSRAVGAMVRERVELVTVAPRQRCDSFWERVVMPQIWALLAFRYPPRRVNRATRSRDIIANGQFILARRAAYERAGTHASVRASVAEDLGLAQSFFRHGLKVHFAFAESLMETRMYQGLGHMIEGWSKNVYLGGRASFPEEPAARALVPLLLILAAVFWLLPPVVLIATVMGAVPGAQEAAAIASAAAFVFWVIFTAGMRIPAWYGLLYPLGTVIMLFIVLRSVWRGGGHVEWKGRIYDIETTAGPAWTAEA